MAVNENLLFELNNAIKKYDGFFNIQVTDSQPLTENQHPHSLEELIKTAEKYIENLNRKLKDNKIHRSYCIDTNIRLKCNHPLPLHQQIISPFLGCLPWTMSQERYLKESNVLAQMLELRRELNNCVDAYNQRCPRL